MRWSVVDLPRPLHVVFVLAFPVRTTFIVHPHQRRPAHARARAACLPTNLPTYGDPARLTHCHTNNQPPFYHVTVHHSAPMWSFRLCRGRAAVENGDVKTATEVRDGERGRRCRREGAVGGAEGRTTKRDREDRQRERETDTQFGTSSGTYVKAPTKFRNRRSETRAVNIIVTNRSARTAR